MLRYNVDDGLHGSCVAFKSKWNVSLHILCLPSLGISVWYYVCMYIFTLLKKIGLRVVHSSVSLLLFYTVLSTRDFTRWSMFLSCSYLTAGRSIGAPHWLRQHATPKARSWHHQVAPGYLMLPLWPSLLPEMLQTSACNLKNKKKHFLYYPLFMSAMQCKDLFPDCQFTRSVAGSCYSVLLNIMQL